MESQTTLAEYGQQYRLRVNQDACGESIIRGKLGHLYEHSAGRLGIVFEAPSGNSRSDKILRARRRRAIASGFLLRQEGDVEAILLFDAGDVKQAALAIRLIQAKKIRKAARPTDGQLRARALFSSRARSRRPCFDRNTSAVPEAGGI
jgi:hypothetical protein